MNGTIDDILSIIPHRPPYRFVDSLQEIDLNHIKGKCFLSKESFFYQGHFPEAPITPGYIITEAMAQIGILAFGIHLVGKDYKNVKNAFLASTDVKFYNVSYPNDVIHVHAEKIYFRFNKLKCNISAYNQNELLLCRGVFSGIIEFN